MAISGPGTMGHPDRTTSIEVLARHVVSNPAAGCQEQAGGRPFKEMAHRTSEWVGNGDGPADDPRGQVMGTG